MKMPPVGYYVRECIKWISVGVAILYAIHLAKSSWPIFFFIIPGIFSASWTDSNSGKENKSKSPEGEG